MWTSSHFSQISRSFMHKLSRSTCSSENCVPIGCQSNWHQKRKQSVWRHWQLWSFSFTSSNSYPVSGFRMTERRTWVSHSGSNPRVLLTQRARFRSSVGWIPWLRFFRGFRSTVRQMSGNLGHIRPRLSNVHQIASKPNIIGLLTATVSDHSWRQWPSLKYSITSNRSAEIRLMKHII